MVKKLTINVRIFINSWLKEVIIPLLIEMILLFVRNLLRNKEAGSHWLNDTQRTKFKINNPGNNNSFNRSLNISIHGNDG